VRDADANRAGHGGQRGRARSLVEEVVVTIKEQKRKHIELDVGQLDDQTLGMLVSGIVQTAPTGTLYAGNPAIQGCVGSLTSAATAWKHAGDDVAADQTKLALDLQNQADARFVVVNGVVQLKVLVETTATTEADIKGAGFKGLTRQSEGPIEIPGVAIFFPKKGHGRAKVSAVVTGNARRFDAQLCLDPQAQNNWKDLDGDGRTHWLTDFPSGTVVWVRFRTQRGHAKSDWSSPVSVTIP
jgi:hypothetical protein